MVKLPIHLFKSRAKDGKVDKHAFIWPSLPDRLELLANYEYFNLVHMPVQIAALAEVIRQFVRCLKRYSLA